MSLEEIKVKKLIVGTLITILVFVLVAIKVYPVAKSKWWNEEEILESKNQELSKKEKETEIHKFNVSHRSPYVDETFPFRTLEEEEYAKKNPEKFNIVHNIYYSWDKVDTANGEFTYKLSKLDNLHQIKFYVDFIRFTSYTEEKTQDKTGMVREIILENSKKLVRQKPEEGIYNVLKKNNSFAITVKWLIGSELWMYIYNNYDDWQFEEGEHLGVPVYIIEGSLSKKTSESLEGPFTLIVTKDTGVILEANFYGKEDAGLSIKVNKIQLNEGNPEDAFNLNLTNNKEVTTDEYFVK